MTGTPLKVGDWIYSSYGGGRLYEVIGWSPRGKVVYRRESGGIDSAWWKTHEDLPKKMSVVKP